MEVADLVLTGEVFGPSDGFITLKHKLTRLSRPKAWALAKTKPTPESRQKGLGEALADPVHFEVGH